MFLFGSKEQLYRALKEEGKPLIGEECARFAGHKSDPWIEGQLQLIRQRAQEYLQKPAPQLSYQLFRRYWEDGDRIHFEDAYFERRGRLLVFSLLCWLEPENVQWLHETEDILWLICSEPFWCIPPHLTGMQDKVLPFNEFATHLDLFSAETGFAIAEVLALCEDRLAPDVVSQAQLQLERRIFAPFFDGRTAFKFEAMKNNWAAVCGGAIGGAALYRLKDRYALASILHRCLGCMRVYLDSFREDGICEEGVSYWNYGFGFFVCFADLLCKRTGGEIDLLAEAKPAAIAKGQAVFYLAGPHTISFSDGNSHSGYRMGLSCYLQNRFPDAAIPDKQYADDLLHDHCFRYCLALRDLLWYDPQACFGLPKESAAWMPDTQWLISRTEKLQLAAKAGHNAESHNHNDCGSFLLLKEGVPMLCDLGAGLYNAQYFGPQRYSVFVNSSRSHNLPVIGGALQQEGRQAAAREVTAALGETDRLSMELSGCYPLKTLQSFQREICHERAAGCLKIRDRFSFSEPEKVTEAFVSRSPIRLQEGCAVFSREGVELRLHFPQELTPSLLEERYPDHRGIEQTAYLLHLEGRPQKEQTLELCFQ
ncbi:MAG: hypothetical protein HFG27_09730 [Provencibacterium sp.]|nr:hypothetical protein [Provencibacterium sp.]